MTMMFRHRKAAWFAMLLALLVGMVPFGAGASEHHTATRTSVTFTSTTVEVLEPGDEWMDDAGIFHFRNNILIDEVSGDISGTATITLHGDFQPAGECTEESCPSYFSIWARLEIEGEEGGWVGTYVQSGSDVPGEEFFADALVLRGTGANAHMSIFAQSTEESESSITFEGVMSSLAMPVEGMDTSVSLCLNPEDFSFTGGYLSTGALEGHGGASGEFLVGGAQWTHTYAVGGTVTLTDEHGSLTIGFAGGAQDLVTPLEFSSHVFGHYMILDGTGAYAELYGSGRIVGTASSGANCAAGFGVNASLYGEAHYN